MSANEEYYGLCRTCRNVANCCFKIDANRQVFYCEQFENDLYQPIADKEPPVTTSQTITNKESVAIVGLCIDCENRKTCSFPKPHGGIWHCEEYK